MLLRILRTRLAPYRPQIAVIVALQFVGTMAALYLPSLNADIIDNGVARGDTGYIMRIGGVMLAISLLQILCSASAVYVGARTAMAFGRDVRAAIFHRISTFSSREVGTIRRAVADHPQHQRRAAGADARADDVHDGGDGPDHDGRRRADGAAGGHRPVVADRGLRPGAVPRGRVRDLPDDPRLPQDAGPHRRASTGSSASRSPASAWSAPSCASPYETRRFGARQRRHHRESALSTGRWMASMFPTVMLVINVSSVAVLWFGGHRVDDGSDADRRADRVPRYLMQILMSVMMATFMLIMVPRAAVCADRIDEVLDTDSSVVPSRPTPSPRSTRGGELELARRQLRLPRRRGAGAPRRVLHGAARPDDRRDHGRPAPARPPLVNLVPRLFDATGGGCSSTVSTCATSTPTLLVEPDRPGAAEALPLLRHRRQNLRYGKPDATDDEIWHALEIAQARDFVEAMPDGLEATDRPGRLQRLRRPAAAAGHRPRADPTAARSTCSTTRSPRSTYHRRPAAGRARAGHHRRHRRRSSPSGCPPSVDADHILVLDEGRVGHRHARRAPDDLRDVPGDRLVPAHRGGGAHERPRAVRARQGQRHAVKAHRARSAAPGGGPGRGPMSAAAWPAQKSMDVRTRRARRLFAGCGRERGTGRRWSCSSRVLSVATRRQLRARRILGHATDLIFTGLFGRAAARPARPRPRPSRRCAHAATISWPTCSARRT